MTLMYDDVTTAHIIAKYGGAERLQKLILCDFFKHGFDGSGSDGGSCIDGRLTSGFFFLGEGEREGEREREREREKGGRSTFACLCAFLSMYLDCSCVFICVDARLASGVCALLSIYLNYACVPPCQRFVRLRIYLSRLCMCVHLY